MEKGGRLSGQVTTKFTAREDGVRVVPLNLYPSLRVQSVTATGQSLDFIQEDRDQDADFWIVLPKPLPAGEQLSVVTTYAEGRNPLSRGEYDVVNALMNTGDGNFYLVGGARESWYPGASWSEGNFANFDMRFTYPKDFKLVASGTQVNEITEGPQTVSRWRSDTPQVVAAFNVGKFKKAEKTTREMSLETYANVEVPDWVKQLQNSPEKRAPRMDQTMQSEDSMLQAIDTTVMAKKAMAEAEVATQIYSDFFGPTPFKRLAMTQQTADNYGQSWPELVWLPISSFFDDTVRHELYGFDVRGYFRVVGPHEVAHQWWGHTVSWASYRDQWMSEGFADMSAALFLQSVNKTPDAFLKFWRDEHELMLERDKEGFRAVDVGPVTLGYRLNNTRTGDIARRLIYPKGAYILHMIRMMMWNPKTGDEAFKAAMHDFVSTYRGKPASTEDFKAVLEKHMTRSMDMLGNGKLDWFFDEYVYGTAIPDYRLEYTLDGMTLNLKVTQSGVDDHFHMPVPVYLEMPNKRVVRLGSVPLHGNNTNSLSVDLAKAGLPEKPRRVLLNYYADVLCDKLEQK
jgi:hypothetical protein